MFRNTDTKKMSIHPKLFQTHMIRSATLLYQLLVYSFISTSNLTMKYDHLTVSFSYKIIGHIVTQYFVYLNPSLFLGLRKKLRF